jgi:hypothetical protein
LVLPLLVALSACGKSDPLEPSEDHTGGSGSLQNGSMSATVNGSAFTATSLTTFTTLGNGVLPATLTVSGGSGTRVIAFSLVGSGVGTFTVAAADVNVVITEGAGQSWQGILSAAGSSGTFTLTTWTANRAVGTFSVTATPTPGTGASGNRTVTNGRFDVTF